MNYLLLDKSNKKMSQIALGTWALADKYWGTQSHSDSLKCIHSALRNGITHFDTAQSYGNGQAENILGQQLFKLRDKVVIASKGMPAAPEKFSSNFDKSLKRLHTDYIDIFYLHWPSNRFDIIPLMNFLAEKREKGIIHYLGISNFNLELLKKIHKTYNIDIAQYGYNFLWRDIEHSIVPWVQKENIMLTAYGVLGQGALTGNSHNKDLRNQNDKRYDHQILFDDRWWPRIQEAMKNLKEVCNKYNIPVTRAVMEWTLEQNIFSGLIMGSRNRSQIEALILKKNLNKETIPNEILLYINEISDEIVYKIDKDDNMFRHKIRF